MQRTARPEAAGVERSGGNVGHGWPDPDSDDSDAMAMAKLCCEIVLAPLRIVPTLSRGRFLRTQPDILRNPCGVDPDTQVLRVRHSLWVQRRRNEACMAAMV